MGNPSAATITGYYPWDMGLLLGDVDLFELKRLDKLCLTVGRQLTIIRISVKTPKKYLDSKLSYSSDNLVQKLMKPGINGIRLSSIVSEYSKKRLKLQFKLKYILEIDKNLDGA